MRLLVTLASSPGPISSESASSSSSPHSSSSSMMTPVAWSKLRRWLRVLCPGLSVPKPRAVLAGDGSDQGFAIGSGPSTSSGEVGLASPPGADVGGMSRGGLDLDLLAALLPRFLRVNTTASPSSCDCALPFALFTKLWPFFKGSHGSGRTPFSAGWP